jgi:hypothetical protein
MLMVVVWKLVTPTLGPCGCGFAEVEEAIDPGLVPRFPIHVLERGGHVVVEVIQEILELLGIEFCNGIGELSGIHTV